MSHQLDDHKNGFEKYWHKIMKSFQHCTLLTHIIFSTSASLSLCELSSGYSLWYDRLPPPNTTCTCGGTVLPKNLWWRWVVVDGGRRGFFMKGEEKQKYRCAKNTINSSPCKSTYSHQLTPLIDFRLVFFDFGTLPEQCQRYEIYWQLCRLWMMNDDR